MRKLIVLSFLLANVTSCGNKEQVQSEASLVFVSPQGTKVYRISINMHLTYCYLAESTEQIALSCR